MVVFFFAILGEVGIPCLNFQWPLGSCRICGTGFSWCLVLVWVQWSPRSFSSRWILSPKIP
jgi:hypothetical protein